MPRAVISAPALALISMRQFDVERAGREQHIVRRFDDIVGFDLDDTISGRPCGFSQNRIYYWI